MKHKIVTNVTPAIIQDKQSLIVMEIQKSEVNALDFSRLENAMAIMDELKIYGRLIVSYDYDDDSRELYEIPEVCSYVRKLLKEHPDYLAYIVPAYETYFPVVFIMIHVVVIGRMMGRAQIVVPDVKEARFITMSLRNRAMGKATDADDYELASDIRNVVHRIGVLPPDIQ